MTCTVLFAGSQRILEVSIVILSILAAYAHVFRLSCQRLNLLDVKIVYIIKGQDVGHLRQQAIFQREDFHILNECPHRDLESLSSLGEITGAPNNLLHNI